MQGVTGMSDILDSNGKNSDSDTGTQKGLGEDEERPYAEATPSTDNIKLKSPSVKSVRPPSELTAENEPYQTGRI